MNKIRSIECRKQLAINVLQNIAKSYSVYIRDPYTIEIDDGNTHIFMDEACTFFIRYSKKLNDSDMNDLLKSQIYQVRIQDIKTEKTTIEKVCCYAEFLKSISPKLPKIKTVNIPSSTDEMIKIIQSKIVSLKEKYGVIDCIPTKSALADHYFGLRLIDTSNSIYNKDVSINIDSENKILILFIGPFLEIFTYKNYERLFYIVDSFCNSDFKEFSKKVDAINEMCSPNSKNRDIAINMISVFCKNQLLNKHEYGLFHDLIMFKTFIQKSEKFMYEIEMSYVRFTKNPAEYMKFISNPQITKEMDFSCKLVPIDEKKLGRVRSIDDKYY